MARVKKNIHEYERRPWWRDRGKEREEERSGGNTVKCHRAILIYGAGKSAKGTWSRVRVAGNREIFTRSNFHRCASRTALCDKKCRRSSSTEKIEEQGGRGAMTTGGEIIFEEWKLFSIGRETVRKLNAAREIGRAVSAEINAREIFFFYFQVNGNVYAST